MFCGSCWFRSNPKDPSCNPTDKQCDLCCVDVADMIQSFDRNQKSLRQLICSDEYIEKWGTGACDFSKKRLRNCKD